MKFLRRLTRFSCAGIVIVGLFMHLFLRDRVDATAVVFYALPLPVILAAAVVLAFKAKRRRLFIALALLIGGAWLLQSFRWHTQAPSDPREVRLIFWNASRSADKGTALHDLTRDFDPHVIALAEPSARWQQADLQSFFASHPQFKALPSHAEILVLEAGSEECRDTAGRLAQHGFYIDTQATLQNAPAHLLVADIDASPFRPRRAQLAAAFAMVKDDPHAIVVGDLNTPRESTLFNEWERVMTHAFDAKGCGFRETWFWGLPVLSLDHVWVGSAWEVLGCEKVWTRHSDHAALMVRLRAVTSR